MNDRFFDFIYKAEQRELEDKLRQRELLRRNYPTSGSEYPSHGKGLKRIWLALVSMLGRE